MNKMKCFYCVLLLLANLLFATGGFAQATSAKAVATDIVVRAKARDAKFIGSSIGGAMVRIRDASSGALLAEGLTAGSTGNTDLIMKKAKKRYTTIAENAAKFQTTLMLDKPVFLSIEVVAPYIKKQASVISQTQVWLVPGKPVLGDGIIVEVPGMVVDILSPQTHASKSVKQTPFEIKANVVMMCGCALSPGGIWDGNSIEVAAIITRNGQPYKTIPMAITDTTSTFSAQLPADGAGIYQVTVYAYDAKTGNTGVDQTSFIIR